MVIARSPTLVGRRGPATAGLRFARNDSCLGGINNNMTQRYEKIGMKKTSNKSIMVQERSVWAEFLFFWEERPEGLHLYKRL